MIPIEYKKIPDEYLEFIEEFKKKINDWWEKYKNDNSSSNIDKNTKFFFRYILKKENLKDFLLTEADKLPNLIECMEKHFPELKKIRKKGTSKGGDSQLYNCLKKVFCDLGYKNLPINNLKISFGIRACPYCNAEALHSQMELGEKDIDIELDHFYPKSRIPYLALCLYNLVPCGHYCNGQYCKHDKDSYELKLINPFTLEDVDGMKFELDVKDAGCVDYDGFPSSCKIIVKENREEFKANLEVFHIKHRYNHIEAREQARDVWFTFQKLCKHEYEEEEEKRVEFYNDLLKKDDLDIKGYIDREFKIDCSHYNKIYSKMSLDFLKELIRTRIKEDKLSNKNTIELLENFLLLRLLTLI